MSEDLGRLALRVLLPGFVGTSLPSPYAELLADGLGGVCLFGSNTADGPDTLAGLTHAIRAAGHDPVVAVDEEGGDVTRLHATSGSPVLGAAALGAVDDVGLTRRTGHAVGRELATVGVTLDLGPVADVNSCADNPVIGTRSFGADPELVARHVVAWLAGLQAAGVAGCAKHFPGHGDTHEDSHLALPVVDADRTLLDRRELVPFAAAVEAGAAAVMTSHVVVPALDAERPATLSAAVLGVLRHDLAYAGCVVTDALDMAGASAGRGIPAAAVQSLAAGADLLCLGSETDPALVRATGEAILAAVGSGALPEARLREAAGRVDRLAAHRGALSAAGDGDADQLAGARRAVSVEGRLPDLAGAVVVRIQTEPTIAVGAVPWGLPADLVVGPGEPLPVAERPVVVQVRDAHRQPGVREQLAGLVAARVDAVVVEWGWPGPAAAGLPRICARGWSRPAGAAVAELLEGAGWAR